MDECLIQDTKHQDVMNHVKQWCNELNVSIYDERKKLDLCVMLLSEQVIILEI